MIYLVILKFTTQLLSFVLNLIKEIYTTYLIIKSNEKWSLE